MKEKFPHKHWKQEYRYFLESPRSAPRAPFTSLIKKAIYEDLNPQAWKVFCKLFAIHFISGAITLFFCPQLGVTLHRETSLLFDFLSRFGEYGCMIACGALFLGGTGLVAALLLRSQEVRVIRKTRALQWALLTFLSLGFFLSIREAETAIAPSLVVAWIVGGLLGGFFTFQLGWVVRSRIRHSHLFLGR